MARVSKLMALLLGAVLAWGCGSAGGRAARVSAGGATFVDPIMQKWSGEYKRTQNVEVDYVAKGSGYGITNVTSRNIDFGCSDAPMTARELEAAKAAGGEVVHVPVTIGAVAIIYNLPGVAELRLSGELLADVYLRKITRWNDPAIGQLNPGVALPDLPITPTARAEGSGTSNIFTEYLSKRSAEFREKVGVGKSPKFPPGVEGKNGSDGLADFVRATNGSLGYVEIAYARRGNLAYASLVNRAGKVVRPEATAVTAAVGEAMKQPQDTEPYSLHPLTFSFTDAGGETSYPIVGASYAILFKKLPADRGRVVVDFLKWAVSDGQKYATELDYAPLPTELTQKAWELLDTVTFE